MSTQEKINLIQNELVLNYKNKIESLLSVCESPIEKLFLINFLAYCESKTGLNTHTVFLYDYPETHGKTYTIKDGIIPYYSYKAPNRVPWIAQGLKHDGDFEITVIPQYKIRLNNQNFRLDFLLIYELPNSVITKVVIECDGHEFHQKNRDQVTYDNRRHRNLIEAGYHVLRYSGSEIYGNSEFSAFKPLVVQIEEIVRLPFKHFT